MNRRDLLKATAAGIAATQVASLALLDREKFVTLVEVSNCTFIDGTMGHFTIELRFFASTTHGRLIDLTEHGNVVPEHLL